MSTLIAVTTLSELYSALSSAKGGETIELAGGDYGKMSLTMQSKFDLTFPSNITITSADADNPAIFSGLDIRGATNLTFDGITFDYSFQASDKIFSRPFNVINSEDITIKNSTFDGDVARGVSAVDDGYGFAIGLSFRNSQGVTVENNEFFDFHRGATFSDSGDVAVTGNNIHSIRMDGLNFSQIDGAIIEDNYIHDFRGSKNSADHSDMIQFWTNGTDSPSTDITIRGNHLDIGEGSATQSIFMRNDLVDRGIAGTEMFYQNITIEGNTIVNSHSHGITVGETAGLSIKNNSVLHADGDTPDGADRQIEIPRINVSAASTDVTIHNNITPRIVGQDEQSDWSVRGNAFVQDQDPSEPGYYKDVFITSSLEMVDGIHQFRALEGGMVDTLQAGAPVVHGASQSAGLSSQFHVTPMADNVSQYHFDASFSVLEGQTLPQGTEYFWTFGDGTTASGVQVNHAFSEGGAYDVALRITLPDGRSSDHTLNLGVDGSTLVSMTSGLGADTELSGQSQIDLGGTGASLSIKRENVANLLGQEEFSISMNIAADSSQSMGEIMRLHGSFIAAVNADGNLSLRIFQDTGEQLRVTTQGIKLNDTAEHDVNVSLKNGVLDVAIDGEVVSSSEMAGTLASNGSHNLTIGNPFGAPNFEGILTAFEISSNESHFDSEASAVKSSEIQEIVRVGSSFIQFYEEPAETPEVVALSPAPLEVAQLPEVPVDSHELVDHVITLTGQNVSAKIARGEVDHILGEDAFAISFTISAANSESVGEVMSLHQSFKMTVTEKGELYTQVFDTDGNRIRLTTEGANLNDTAEHDVKLFYENDMVELYVDGRMLSYAEMKGPLGDVGRHDLTFGSPWNDKNFDGAISNFEVATHNESYSKNSSVLPYLEPEFHLSQQPADQHLSEPTNQVDQFEIMVDLQQISFFG